MFGSRHLALGAIPTATASAAKKSPPQNLVAATCRKKNKNAAALSFYFGYFGQKPPQEDHWRGFLNAVVSEIKR